MYAWILNHLLFDHLNRHYRRGVWYGFASLIFVFHLPLSESCAQTINSRAAVVVDASTGEVLYSKNPNRCLPAASTTKLMTAILAIENENLSNVVAVSKNAVNVRPSKAGFHKGDKVTVEGLLYAALLRSANDAAVALAEAVAGSEEKFVLLMNDKAKGIGATSTKFINSTGLPGPGQYITALDLSRILKYAMRYPKLKEIIGTPTARISTEEGRTFFLKNTDKLLWSDEEVIGGKTGYTDSAKHCFVGVAEHEKEMVIVAILGSPRRRNLWEEARKLIAKGIEQISLRRFKEWKERQPL